MLLRLHFFPGLCFLLLGLAMQYGVIRWLLRRDPEHKVPLILATWVSSALLTAGYLIYEPEHVQAFMNSPNGVTILIGGFALEIIGAIWMWRILKIDY